MFRIVGSRFITPARVGLTKGPLGVRPLGAPFRSFATKREEAPKFRYLVYVFLFSTALLVFVSKNVNKKQPKRSFTEREFEAQEEDGLKRRKRLVQDNDKYQFYVVPYVHSNEVFSSVAKSLDDKQVIIIDPEELVIEESKDNTRRYSLLIQDLLESKKTFPRGLITALIKNEVHKIINSTKGIYDTNFLIKNYPQFTEDAIKFENDISKVQKCIELDEDVKNELNNEKSPREVRSITNVIGYFETVDKVTKVRKN